MSSAMTGNVLDLNAEELDSILLDDPISSQLRASNSAALGKLLSTVIALAKTSRTQMRRITGAIGEHVSALEKAPELIADSFAQGTSRTSTRTTEELKQLVHAVVDANCTAVVAELAHMARVDDFLRKLEELLAGDVAQALDGAFSQAEHDDRCMRELADLLQVNSSDVVEEIKKLLAQRKDRLGAEIRGPGNVNQRVLAPNQSTSTSRLGRDFSSDMDAGIGRMFAAMTLPEVEVFRDPQGRKFEDFILRFTMKYPYLGLSNDMLVHLLLSKLDGFPKAVAEALPKHIREGDFDVLVEALKAKFKLNDSAEQMKAYMELKRLRKKGDVTSYCLELESLTSKAHPDASDEQLSRTRAGELVAQLSDWPEYFQLYTAMELAPKGCAYEMVKTMAQRCERSKEVAATLREVVQEGGPRRSQLDHRNPSQAEVRKPLPDRNVRTLGTFRADREGTFKGRIDGPRCFKCRKFGHLRRACQEASRSARTREMYDRRSAAPRTFTTSLNRWICGSIGANKGRDELFGEQTVAEVKLLGLSRKALLDTGSQISIMPLEIFQASMAAGFDLDKDVEEIPINHRIPVYDASGNRMSFKGAVRLTLQLGKGEKQKIALFVTAGGDGMLVLGTNALMKLGIGLIPNKKQSHKRRKQRSGVVTADERVFMRPKKTRKLQMARDEVRNEEPVRSKDRLLPDRIRNRKSGAIKVPNASSLAGAKLLGGGEVGAHKKPFALAKSSSRRRGKKQRADVNVGSGTVLPPNLPKPAKVCPGGRIHSGTSRIENTGPGEIPVGKSSSAAAKLSKAAENDESQAKKKRGKRRRSRRKPREASSIGNGADCLRMSIEGGHLPNLAQQVCRIGADSRLEKSPFTGRREIHLTANDVCDLEEHDFESPGMEKRRRNDEVQTGSLQQNDEGTKSCQNKRSSLAGCYAKGTTKPRDVEDHPIETCSTKVKLEPQRGHSRSIQCAVPWSWSRDDSRFRRGM